MNNTGRDSNEILAESYDQYYSIGNPKRQRTGTLKGASKIELSIGGDSAHITAGYDGTQISYPPGDGTFSGQEVFEATATGTYGVLGNPEYDEKALKKIVNMAKENFRSQFG